MGIIRLKKEKTENTKVQTIVSEEPKAVAADNDVAEWEDSAILGEDKTNTDMYSRHYFLNNGTAKSIIGASPVNYREEETGRWRPIDNTFSEKADCYEVNLGKFTASLDKVSSVKRISLSGKGVNLSWTYLGASMPVNVKAMSEGPTEEIPETTLSLGESEKNAAGSKGSRAVYENASPELDLEYRFNGNNVKENIVVKEKSETYRYLFKLDTQGLKLRVSEDNANLELYSKKVKEDGEKEETLEFTVPAPYMYDSNGEASEEVYYELEPETDGKYTFAVVADADWINAPERAFPVVIDPQIVTDNGSVITKQVQRKMVSSSSGSGTNWVNVTETNIKAGTSGAYSYRTELTVKGSELSFLNYKIVKATLILKAIGSVIGSFSINYRTMRVSEEMLYADVTSELKNVGTQNIEFMLTGTSLGNFYAPGSAYPPILEIEYITNEDVIPTRKTFTLAGAGTAEVDLSNGDMVAGFCDVSAENSVMGLEVAHVYKKSAENCLAGENFRLSLNENFVKNGSSALDTTYVYTDAKGEKHGFKEYYYYINTSGQKTYIAKSSVSVETDGTLKYDGYNVTAEYRSQTGLKAVTEMEDIKKVELLEQRSDEYKQLEEQVESYKNAYKEFVLLDTSSGENTPLSEGSIFGNYESSQMPIPKAEALQYKSLKKQFESLNKTYLKADIMVPKTEANDKNNLVPLTGSVDSAIASLKTSIAELSERLIRYTNNCTRDSFIDEKNAICSLLAEDTNTVSPDNYQLFTADHCEYPEFRDANREEVSGTPKQSGAAIHEMFRQRNLLVLQLATQTEELENQEELVKDQMKLISDKKNQYIYQVQNYYKEYKNKSEELEQMKRQMPVNFLTDGRIIKGYNEDGKLVAVYDNYENYAVVEYEAYRKTASTTEYRIRSLYDNTNKQVRFSYRDSDNLLESITDTRGRRVSYDYRGAELTKICYGDGRETELVCSDGRLQKVLDSAGKEQAVFTYNGGKIDKITTQSTVKKISSEGVETQTAQEIDSTAFAYTFASGNVKVSSTLITGKSGNREKYIFDSDGNCTEYRKEEGGVVTEAEQYEYEPYWKGTVKQSNPHRTVKQARLEDLNKKPLESFIFTADYTETAKLNEYEKVSEVTTSGVKLTSEGTNKATYETEYEYDENQKLISETEKVTYSKSGAKAETSHKKYYYNAQGNVIRTESWVEGEEQTRGKEIEETEYDEKGNIKRRYTYNSLDSASKFYTENEYSENGQVVSEYDETGENKVKYEYGDDTNIVRREILPNGSKVAYGHDFSDTVTSITQSTEDGEENSTSKKYVAGEVVEVRSGDTVVKYTYDGKRRIKQIDLNGETPYESIAYTDDTTENGVSGKVDKAELTNAKGEKFMTVKDKSGRIVKTKYNGTEQAVYTYTEGKLTGIEDKETKETEGYEYDNLNRETKHSFGGKSRETSYGDYGEVTVETLTYGSGDTVTYGYEYTNDSAKELKKISVSEVEESYERDALGRKKKTTQKLGSQTYSERYGYYKVGDHATNRINTIFYGKNGETDGKETYTYDEMGNIVSVNKNGVQKKKYGYDKLGRLTFEKNLDKNEEICYTYDDKGNIETKSIKGSVKEYKYEEGTDRLIGYGEEKFEYDAIGNPLKYCELTLTWEKGRRLKSASNGSESVTYTYDAFGMRRSKTAGGTETSYVYERGKLIREIRGSEKIDYLYGEDGIIGIKIGSEKYLYRKNVFGDVTEIYDEAGTLVGKYNYNAFGECEIETDEGGIAEKNPIRYRGYYYDEETGFYYLKTRYYDPEIGRFITIDDTSYLDHDSVNGLNLYCYCGNNPVMNVDPEGTSWWSSLWRTIAVVGLAVLAVGAIAAITFVTGGAVAPVLIGAGIGFVTSGVISGITQFVTTGSIDVFQLFVDMAFGAVTGAFGGSALGILGMTVAGGATGFAGSVASDFVAGRDIQWGMALASAVIGAAFGALSGGGAQYGKNATLKSKLSLRRQKRVAGKSLTAINAQIKNERALLSAIGRQALMPNEELFYDFILEYVVYTVLPVIYNRDRI
mgnify:FL=1